MGEFFVEKHPPNPHGASHKGFRFDGYRLWNKGDSVLQALMDAKMP